MIRDVDTSGDGEIDYNEFSSYFLKSELDTIDVPSTGTRVLRKRKTEQLGVAIDQLLDAAKPSDVGAAVQQAQQTNRLSRPANSDATEDCLPVLLGARRRTASDSMEKL